MCAHAHEQVRVRIRAGTSLGAGWCEDTRENAGMHAYTVARTQIHKRAYTHINTHEARSYTPSHTV
jgi:hypothetical protein